MIGSALRDPAAVRVALARFISRAGGEAAFFVGIWGKAAFEFGASPGEQALMMASLGLSALLGSALAGVLVDRFDPRRVLIGAEVVVVPSTLAVILPTTMEQMTWTVAVFGFSLAAVLTAVGSLPPFLTDDPSRLHRINALVEGAGSAAFIAGPDWARSSSATSGSTGCSSWTPLLRSSRLRSSSASRFEQFLTESEQAP